MMLGVPEKTLTCRRCQQPVIRFAADYETFERMHWSCFHYPFEHELEGASPDPDVARRRRLVRGSLAPVAAAAAAAVVIAVGNVTGGDEPSGPADRTSQSPERTIEPPQATPLMAGTYLSEPVNFAEIASNVRAQAGGQRWVEPLRQKLGMVDGRRIKLVLDGQTITATIPGTTFAYTRPYHLESDNDIVIDFPGEPKDWEWWAHYSINDASGNAGQRPTVTFQE